MDRYVDYIMYIVYVNVNNLEYAYSLNMIIIWTVQTLN